MSIERSTWLKRGLAGFSPLSWLMILMSLGLTAIAGVLAYYFGLCLVVSVAHIWDKFSYDDPLPLYIHLIAGVIGAIVAIAFLAFFLCDQWLAEEVNDSWQDEIEKRLSQ